MVATSTKKDYYSTFQLVSTINVKPQCFNISTKRCYHCDASIFCTFIFKLAEFEGKFQKNKFDTF